jgi:hypothetical protein
VNIDQSLINGYFSLNEAVANQSRRWMYMLLVMASGFVASPSITSRWFLRPHFKLVKWLVALNYLQATSSVEKGVRNEGKRGVSIYMLWG